MTEKTSRLRAEIDQLIAQINEQDNGVTVKMHPTGTVGPSRATISVKDTYEKPEDADDKGEELKLLGHLIVGAVSSAIADQGQESMSEEGLFSMELNIGIDIEVQRRRRT